MRRRILQGGLFLFTWLWSPAAFAECALSLQGLVLNQFVTVDAGSIHRQALTKTVSFGVENTGPSDCMYFVTMDEGVSGDMSFQRLAKITHALPAMFQSASSDAISYQLYSETVAISNIVKTLDEATFTQNVLGPRLIKAGQTVTESFLIHVPSQTLPDLIAESYEDNVVLTLYQNPDALIDVVTDCPTCTEEDQQSLNLQFSMTDYTTLALGNSYDPSTRKGFLDFGDVKPNQTESFQIYVGGRSSGGSACTVTVSSENGSALRHEKAKDNPNPREVMDYSVHVQPGIGTPIVSSDIDLSSPNVPVQIATSSLPFICGSNSEGVMSMEVFIKIGEIENKLSGKYSDTLTVEAKIGL